MMTTHIEEFVAKFHSLNGITISERKRNLFRLFNQASILHSDRSLLDGLTAQLQPHTYLEQTFLIQFWIYFRRYEELARELFVNENPILIKQIKNQRWFFEQMLAENRSEFVTKIVSIISYSLTLKILKYIVPVLKEQEADTIFDSLLETYGISLALNIVTSCSCTKIEEILKEFSIRLRPNQLKSLFDKHPLLVYIYLEEREKYAGNRKFMDNNPIFEYIAQKDINAYQDLCIKYGFEIKLGKRASAKFITVKRQDILTHPEIYVKNLHPRRLIKQLGPDFPGVYLKLFPKKVDDSPSAESSRLLEHYPKKGRYNLMLTTYNKIFAKKLEESPHLIDDYVLEMVRDSQEREKLAKLKTGEDPDAYLKYHTPENCFKTIKEKINFARQPYERGLHVTTLVQSCIVNNDYEALLEVAKFVTERFKNDGPEVQEKFLQVLLWQKADFSRLREEHWHEISKITARSDLYTYYDHTNYEIFYKYMEFLHKTGKPINDEMVAFFKKKDFSGDHLQYIRDKHTQKTFLGTLIEVAPNAVADSNSIESFDCHILAACFKYNSKNPKLSIDVFQYPRLLNSVKNTLTNKITVEETTLAAALELLLGTKSQIQGVEDLRELFWGNIQNATPNIMRWFVTNRPEFIEKNLTTFLTFAIENTELSKDARLWRRMKYYSHLGLDQKSTEFCSAQLTPQKCIILSNLMPKHDFLTLVESHRPGSKDKGDFNIQMALLNGLKNINSPLESLSTILQFCEGDYVPLCLRPLYSIVSRVPRNNLQNCMNNIKEKTAVTKHAYYIESFALKKETVLRSLRECFSEYSLLVTFKNFLNNPSDEAWMLFVTKLQAQETFDSVTSTVLAKKNVPLRYKSDHFENVWMMFYQKDNKYKSLLFKNVQKDTIMGLKADFMYKTIEAELFKNTDCNKLVSIFMISSTETDKLGVLSMALDKYKDSEQFSIKAINNFVNVLFAIYMDWNMNYEKLTIDLLAMFEKKFPITEIFDEYITLSCLRFKGQDPKHLSRSIIELHNNLIARYGETIMGIFVDILKKIIPHFYKQSLEKYQLYYFLVAYKKSLADVLLVTKLLPIDSEAEDKESDEYYELVLKQLQEVNLANVQLHLNIYFKRYKVARNVSYYEKINHICINTSSWLCPGARRKIGYNYY